MDRTALQTRITSRMTEHDTGYLTPCWISNRAAHTGGYTKIGYLGATWLTHRFAYVVFVGPIPDGLQLDHLCRVRACCRPDHLEPVTCRENLLRGDTLTAAESRATHCINLDPFNTPNTRLTAKGKRACRECDRVRSQRYRNARLAHHRGWSSPVQMWVGPRGTLDPQGQGRALGARLKHSPPTS